jgi:hypothetical protein
MYRYSRNWGRTAEPRSVGRLAGALRRAPSSEEEDLDGDDGAGRTDVMPANVTNPATVPIPSTHRAVAGEDA